MGLYIDMFDTVLTTGNAAKGMVKSIRIENDVSIDDVEEGYEKL